MAIFFSDNLGYLLEEVGYLLLALFQIGLGVIRNSQTSLVFFLEPFPRLTRQQIVIECLVAMAAGHRNITGAQAILQPVKGSQFIAIGVDALLGQGMSLPSFSFQMCQRSGQYFTINDDFFAAYPLVMFI